MIAKAKIAAYCGLVLAGVPCTKASLIVRSTHTTLKDYLPPDWFGWGSRPEWRLEKVPRVEGRTLRRMSLDQFRERYAPVIDFHDGGKRTLQEVGQRFGVTRERVRQILARAGIADRSLGRTPRAEKEAALEVYGKALNERRCVRDAAALAGRNYSSLHKWAIELGVPMPKPRSPRRERWSEIARFYQENADLKQRHVAEHFGVSQHEVSRALKEMGVPSRWWTSPDVAARRHAPRSPLSPPHAEGRSE